MEWSNVRQLTWCNVLDENGNGTVHTFAYGADGIRYQKNNITYTLDENKILRESDGEKTITYHYGVNGVIGFRLDKDNLRADYYYCKNLFGDVVAIYAANGILVAEYEYDAWGKVTVTNKDNSAYGTLHNNVGDINPIRYRSYYYDTETDLYYLESRYYDPETGRFINADSLEYLGDGEELNNYNLFAYCGNNPVMRTDPSGHFFLHIALTALLSGLISAGVNAVIQLCTENGDVNPYEVLIAGLAGAVSGALPWFCSSGLGLFVGNMAISATENIAGQILENGGLNNFSVGDLIYDSLIGGAAGVLGGPTNNARYLNNLGLQGAQRTAQAFTRHGFSAGFREGKKAFSYYIKLSGTHCLNILKKSWKDALDTSFTSSITCDGFKTSCKRWFS